MSKKKKIFIGGIVSFVLVAIVATIAIITAISNNNNEVIPEIYAEDLICEFDGLSHKIEASTTGGYLSYEYHGVDCNYASALEPTEPGEYDVTITYNAYKGDTKITKNVKLFINLPYEISEDGTRLLSYIGTNQDVILPKSYRNISFNSMGDDLFKNSSIKTLKVPQNTFYVNPSAIKDSGIEKLFVHENTILLDGEYPNNLTVEYYGNSRKIHNEALVNVSGLKELILPSTIITIEEDALSTVSTSKLIIYSNNPLSNINLSSNIKSVYVCPTSNDDDSYYNDGVSLADQFFENCAYIEKIEIGKGITALGRRSFYNCSSLKELTFYSTIEEVDSDCFKVGYCLDKLNLYFDHVDDGYYYNDEYPKLGLDCINIVEFKECEKIPRSLFCNCEEVKKVILPNSIKIIENGAFAGCINLEEINLPDGLEKIDNCAFMECNLVDVVIPDSVKEIGIAAFEHCKNLKSVILPINITSIPLDLFWGCESLEEVNIPDGVSLIDAQAFYDCKNLRHISIPSSVTTIAGGAFEKCKNLNNIIIPSSVDFIGDYAFEFGEFDSLQLFISSLNTKSLGSHVFADCTSDVEELILPNSITTLTIFSMSNIYNLKKVRITSDDVISFIDDLSILYPGVSNPPNPYDDKCYGATKIIYVVPAHLLEEYKESYPRLQFEAVVE